MEIVRICLKFLICIDSVFITNTTKKGPIPHCFTELDETILLLIELELEPETACFSVIT